MDEKKRDIIREARFMEAFISTATKRNWKKLNVAESHTKLVKRANKINSKRYILPVEYFSNTKNISEIEKLIHLIRDSDIDISDAMYSIIINCFKSQRLIDNSTSLKINIKRFMDEYSYCTAIAPLLKYELPSDEEDLLGLIYQSFYTEGDKNKQGLYYTPPSIVREIVSEIDFSNGQTYLDPCCGSGSYLINIPNATPQQLFGIDSDAVAVMLCKANLILKFKTIDVIPQVFCFDFLEENSLFDLQETINARNITFNYIFTNPPWGAISRPNDSRSQISTSKESFSRFLLKALDMLNENGTANLLLPEAVLNVKTHSKLRERLIKQYAIEKIQIFPNLFTGVTTKFVSLELKKSLPVEKVSIYKDGVVSIVNRKIFEHSNKFVFSLIDAADQKILDALFSRGYSSLSDSVWALGIVTGDNSKKLFDIPVENSEPIYTGKEIRPYRLLPPVKHIIYDRSQFQQTAKDEIYRAEEKLIYKFISNKLVFAYDNAKRLFLNSANILIPVIPTMSITSVLLFLNSELFRFAYIKRFGEIKILKGNLCELPFPKLTFEEDSALQSIADKILNGHLSSHGEAQKFIYDYYRINSDKIEYIEGVVGNGKLT
jgi:predicted RNA methylase